MRRGADAELREQTDVMSTSSTRWWRWPRPSGGRFAAMDEATYLQGRMPSRSAGHTR